MKLSLICASGFWCLLSSTAAAQETQTYSYDVHGRLTDVQRTSGSSTRTTTYALDNADNRTQRATSLAAGRAMLDSAPSNDAKLQVNAARPEADAPSPSQAELKSPASTSPISPTR